MSVLTTSDICESVRRRFGLPEGDALRFQPLVNPALRRLAYDVAKDSSLRDWLITDPSMTTTTLDGNGVADLTALIANPRILLECLKYGDILPPVGYPSTQPFRMIATTGQGQLSGAYDALVYKCFLNGVLLGTKSPDNNVTPLAGVISFQVPYWPTLVQLPEPLIERLVNGPYWLEPLIAKENAA